MSISFHRAILFFCCALVLSACVLINRFDKMETKVSSAGVSFTLPGAKDNQKVILGGITVWAENCERDCVYWEMTRPAVVADSPLLATTLPITYGASFSGLQTRVHKPLKPGLYRVSAGLGVVRDSGGTDEIKVIGEFSIP